MEAIALTRGTATAALNARRADVRSAAAKFRRQVSRYRLDYRWLPSGEIAAILTVTLPNGSVMRFQETGNPTEIAEWIRKNRPEVGFSLGGLWKGIKKVAKSVATSKVFKTATTALAAAAPALGPFAPAAMAASTAMKASTYLLAARQHSAKGTPQGKAAAKKLVAAAAKVAKKQPTLDVAQAHSAKLYTMLLRPA